MKQFKTLIKASASPARGGVFSRRVTALRATPRLRPDFEAHSSDTRDCTQASGLPLVPFLSKSITSNISAQSLQLDRDATEQVATMTVEADAARTDMPSDDRERIRACSIGLSSGSQLLGNLQWSNLGQALVVTDDALLILSPLTGLHPDLAKQAHIQDVECHPDWQDRFPHSIAQINIKTFLENEHSLRTRTILESDHSAVDPRFAGARWVSASWSKPEMGPHGSCLVLAMTSEMDLFVLGAPQNAWTGDWKVFHAIECGPVADLTELEGSQISHSASGGNEEKSIFTPSRALLRKKQLATEVVSATFIDAEIPDRQQACTLVAAGTRSGHIAIWQCTPISGVCTFMGATSVSSTGIENLTVSTHSDAIHPGAQARFTFQDADSIRLADLCWIKDRFAVQLSEAPPVQAHHCQVTARHWLAHHFVYATIGRAHVYDVRSQHQEVFSLAVDSDSILDPYSPAICISDNADDRSVKIVVQDLREFRIPLTPGQSQTSTRDVLPIYPSKLTGYPPLTEKLNRKHDLYQAFMGYQTEHGSSLSTASIVGAVRTKDRVAFLGYDVSDTISYQLEIVRSTSVGAAAILDEALQRLAGGRPAFLLVRIILGLLYTSRQQPAFRTELVSAIEGHWRVLMGAHEEGSNRVQQQFLFLLTCRLSSTSSDTPLEGLKVQYRASILKEWIHRWTSDLSQRPPTDAEDQRLLSRLSAADRLLSNASERSSGAIATDENCAACDSQLSLSWEEQRQDFGWTRCQSGHVWPRCSVSLETISDREVRVCSGCWAKALLPKWKGDWQTTMLQSAEGCMYCGSLWIVR